MTGVGRSESAPQWGFYEDEKIWRRVRRGGTWRIKVWLLRGHTRRGEPDGAQTVCSMFGQYIYIEEI